MPGRSLCAATFGHRSAESAGPFFHSNEAMPLPVVRAMVRGVKGTGQVLRFRHWRQEMTSARTEPAWGAGGQYAERSGYGLGLFASVMLVIVGWFNLIYGIAAIANSHVFTANAHYVFGNLRSWGWITLIIGVLQLLAAAGVLAGNQLARWYGGAVLGLSAIDQMFFIPAYPFWSLTIIALDVVALYVVCAHGSRANLEAAQHNSAMTMRDIRATRCAATCHQARGAARRLRRGGNRPAKARPRPPSPAGFSAIPWSWPAGLHRTSRRAAGRIPVSTRLALATRPRCD